MRLSSFECPLSNFDEKKLYNATDLWRTTVEEKGIMILKSLHGALDCLHAPWI